jgi:hypothetical protein
LNFASVTGGFGSNFSTTLSYGYPSLSTVYHERLTTTVP